MAIKWAVEFGLYGGEQRKKLYKRFQEIKNAGGYSTDGKMKKAFYKDWQKKHGVKKEKKEKKEKKDTDEKDEKDAVKGEKRAADSDDEPVAKKAKTDEITPEEVKTEVV